MVVADGWTIQTANAYCRDRRSKGCHRRRMKLHGSINTNLSDAIASAERLRGKPVYAETLNHWNELLREARRVSANHQGFARSPLDALINRLETELAIRPR
jgi:hypothetical protein